MGNAAEPVRLALRSPWSDHMICPERFGRAGAAA